MPRRVTRARVIYSWALSDVIETQIPKPVLDALKQNGWNVFGIYELVKDAIAEERREKLKIK